MEFLLEILGGALIGILAGFWILGANKLKEHKKKKRLEKIEESLD